MKFTENANILLVKSVGLITSESVQYMLVQVWKAFLGELQLPAAS